MGACVPLFQLNFSKLVYLAPFFLAPSFPRPSVLQLYSAICLLSLKCRNSTLRGERAAQFSVFRLNVSAEAWQHYLMLVMEQVETVVRPVLVGRGLFVELDTSPHRLFV